MSMDIPSSYRIELEMSKHAGIAEEKHPIPLFLFEYYTHS